MEKSRVKKNLNIKYSDSDLDDDDYEEKESHFFRRLFFALILFIVLVVIYARYIGTSGLIMKEYNIVSNNLPKSFNGLKIVHFSDFHYGKTTDLNSLKRLVSEINSVKPDIIIFTGDFIDKEVSATDEEITKMSVELLKLESTYGNYYITGNQDTRFSKYDQFMTNSNFIDLNDKFDVIYSKNNDSILLNGLAYRSDLYMVKELFNYDLPPYKINIMHTPDTFSELDGCNFDLVLAGHSHNGQVVLPFYGPVFTPSHAKEFYKPYYKVNNTHFYISSGIGTTRYSYRLFNRPSFSLYRLKSKAQ